MCSFLTVMAFLWIQMGHRIAMKEFTLELSCLSSFQKYSKKLFTRSPNKQVRRTAATTAVKQQQNNYSRTRVEQQQQQQQNRIAATGAEQQEQGQQNRSNYSKTTTYHNNISKTAEQQDRSIRTATN